MLEPHLGFQVIAYGFDDEAPTQHQLVGKRHEIISHVAPDAGDQVQTGLSEISTTWRFRINCWLEPVFATRALDLR
jgi:hypothetical protein